MHPVMTPFGPMRSLPPWEKSDAMDMVLVSPSGP